MNSFVWRIRKWYLKVRLNLLRRQVRILQRRFFRRSPRPRQLELPFRG